MKVRILQTVYVDPEAWADEFGIDVSEVRVDVGNYFAGSAQVQVDLLGLAPEEDQSR